jgi:hypothetical protein
MPRQKTIAAGESVGLKLTAAERELILESLLIMDSGLQDRVRQATALKEVPFTLDELDDLHGNLAAEANHTDDGKLQRKLDNILRKIEKLQDSYCEAPEDDAKDASPRSDESVVPMICGSSEVPAEFRRVYLDIVSLTDEFCNEKLNLEYQELCRKMAISMCQAGSPVLRGKPASWACGIVCSAGWVNFLGDPSQEPHVRAEDIAKWFGVSTATMHSKSRVIREGLGLMPLDPEYTLPSRLDDNPFVWMLECDNGMIIDIRHAPREVQVKAFERGLIPYVPADRE